MRLHTPLTELSVAQLEKYQNYTVQVSALTRVGEGARSRSVYCRTNEDLPSPPANISARPTSAFSILVRWDPPGDKVKKYKLYHRRVSRQESSE